MPASRKRKGLTELEGTIMSAVMRSGGITPYRLRQAFLVSPSVEWSGSAGAVYPALHRLKAAGLLSAVKSGDGRGTETYRVTELGQAALLAWAGDIERALSAGIDPFRSRVQQWLILPAARRAPILRALEKALKARCEALRAKIATIDDVDRVQAVIELELQQARQRWVAAHR